MRSIAVVTCLVAGVAVPVGLSAASPGPKWLPAQDLSATGADGVAPDVAVDGSGNAYVVWTQAQGSRWTIELAERPVGGAWSAPKTLSIPAGHVGRPVVVAEGTRVVAVWERYDGKSEIAQVTSRNPRTGQWSPAVSLPPQGRNAVLPWAAVNSRGDAVIVWSALTGTGWTIQSSYRVAGHGFRPDADLESPLPGTAAADVALDDAGNAVAVWQATKDGRRWTVRSAYRSARTGHWGKVVDVSGPDLSGSIGPQLVLEKNGDAVAVWSRSEAPGTTTVERSTRSAGPSGTWSRPQRVPAAGESALAPQIVTNRRGSGVIVWTNSGPSGLTIVASYRKAGGGWGKPVSISRAVVGSTSPEVALDENGWAVVVWTHTSGGHALVQAAARDPSQAAWSTAKTLSKPGADALLPQVALDTRGDGAVVWSRYDSHNFVVQAVGYDATGPQLDGLSVPTGGVAGAKLAFSVSPKDVWSSIGAVRWSFGDGARATGRQAAHAYAKPGKYTASLTVSDSSGHVSSIRRTISIASG